MLRDSWDLSSIYKMTPGNHNLPVIWPYKLKKRSRVFAFGCISLHPCSSGVECCSEAVMDCQRLHFFFVCLFVFWTFYFVLEYSRLTVCQVNSKGTQPSICVYPFSPNLPSHPGCHITLSRVPCAIWYRSLLVFQFKYSSVYIRASFLKHTWWVQPKSSVRLSHYLN